MQPAATKKIHLKKRDTEWSIPVKRKMTFDKKEFTPLEITQARYLNKNENSLREEL